MCKTYLPILIRFVKAQWLKILTVVYKCVNGLAAKKAHFFNTELSSEKAVDCLYFNNITHFRSSRNTGFACTQTGITITMYCSVWKGTKLKHCQQDSYVKCCYFCKCITTGIHSVGDLLTEVKAANGTQWLQEMQRKAPSMYLQSLNGRVWLEADHSHLWNENLWRLDRPECFSEAPQ